MFARSFSRPLRQAAVASALFFALGGAAWAGPGHHGAGPGYHGAGPRGGAQVEQVIAHLKGQLNLNTSQQVAFDNAVAASRAARDAVRGDRDAMRGAMQTELANPAPNLRNIAALRDQAQAKHQAAHKQVREQWLQLYDTFSAEQKQVVRDALTKRMARMDAFRERMQNRVGG